MIKLPPPSTNLVYEEYATFHKEKVKNYPSYFVCKSSNLAIDLPPSYQEVFCNLYMLNESLHQLGRLYCHTSAKKTLQTLDVLGSKIYTQSVLLLSFTEKYPDLVANNSYPQKYQAEILSTLNHLKNYYSLDENFAKKLPKKLLPYKDSLPPIYQNIHRYSTNLVSYLSVSTL
jgi:hypothetical protein